MRGSAIDNLIQMEGLYKTVPISQSAGGRLPSDLDVSVLVDMYVAKAYSMDKSEWQSLLVKPGHGNLKLISYSDFKKSLRNAITNPMRDRKRAKKESSSCSKITTQQRAIPAPVKVTQDPVLMELNQIVAEAEKIL